MSNIRPDRDSSLVPSGYKPQSIRMSHRGRPPNIHTFFSQSEPYPHFVRLLLAVLQNTYATLTLAARGSTLDVRI